jgi:CxxC motif-containing protein (DUF1111 family)
VADHGEQHFGEKKFSLTGYAICHVSPIVTAPPGTPINGGAFTAPDLIGNKTIRPYSDFLLHDSLSFTADECIQRDAGQAANVTAAFNRLNGFPKAQLIESLDAL